MADSSVTIRVRLTDDGQVKTSLRAVGEQGKAAADQIKSAMAGINFSHATAEANKLHAALTRMRQPLTMLQSAFAGFAGNVFSQLASSLTQLPGLFNEVINKTMEVTKEFADFAEQTGSTVEEISTFIGALGQFGVAFESVEGAMKKLSVTINDKWAEIVKDIEGGSEKSRKGILAVEQATLDLAEAQRKAATSQKEANLTAAQSQMRVLEIEKEQSRQSTDRRNQEVNNAISIRGAQLGLYAARVRLAELESGGKLWADEQRALDIDQARVAVLEARQRLTELIEKRERDRQDAADRAAKLELDRQQAAIKAAEDAAKEREDAARRAILLETAQLNLKKAQDDQREAERNSVQNLAAVVEDIAAGREPSKEVNLSPENIVKGLIASVGRGATDIGKFGDSVEEITAKAPDLFPVMMKMADFFKGLGNRALATATLTKLFGKAVSGNMVDAFMAGGAALKKFMEEQKKAGLATTKEEADLAERFVQSRNRLLTNWEALKRKMAAEFGRFPGFDTWNNLLLENAGAVQKWAATLGQLFDSVSFALANLLTGKSFEQFAAEMRGKMSPEQLLQVKQWQESLGNIAKAFEILGNGIKTVFALFAPLVQAAADAGRTIGNLFDMGKEGEGLAVVLAIGAILFGLKRIPILVGAALLALGRLFTAGAAAAGGAAGGAAAGGGLAAFFRKGLAGIAALGGGVGIFKLAESEIVDKYKKDLDELNAKFKDKSSAEYVAGLAKIRKEFLEDTKNLESFREELGIPKSGAIEALEKELGLLKEIGREREKRKRSGVPSDDDVTIGDLEIRGGPIKGGTTRAAAGQATMAANLFKAGIEATTLALQANRIAINETTVALISIRDQILMVVAVLEDFRRVLQKTIEDRGRQKEQPAPGQETKPAPDVGPKPAPGPGPEPDRPPGDAVLDWERRMRADELSPGERELRRRDDAQMAPVLEILRTAPRTEEGTLTPETLREIGRMMNPRGTIKTFPRGEGIDGGEDRAADFRDTFQQFSAAVDRFAVAPRAAEDAGGISAVLASFNQAILNCIAALEKFSAALSQSAQPRAADTSPQVKELMDLIKFATPPPESRGGPNPWEQARASGGMISGPGTGTSDSIMARLSNGEFVMSARAVGRYGAPFMRAINGGRFALGGLVESLTSIMPPSMLPRFAAGGLARAGGGHTLNLTIDGNRFGGLGVPDRVAGRLERYAIANQVSSLGRKPSWRK